MSNRMAPFVADRGDADLRRPPQKPAPPTKPLRVGHRVVQPLPGRLDNAKLVPRDEPGLPHARSSGMTRRCTCNVRNPAALSSESGRAGGNERSADMALGESTPLVRKIDPHPTNQSRKRLHADAMRASTASASAPPSSLPSL